MENSNRTIGLGLLALVVLVAVATPAWQSRGEAVERQYKAFVANLEVDRLALRARIDARAPELASRLSPAPIFSYIDSRERPAMNIRTRRPLRPVTAKYFRN